MNTAYLLLALNCLLCKSNTNAHANLRKRKLDYDPFDGNYDEKSSSKDQSKEENSHKKKDAPPSLPKALSASFIGTPTVTAENSNSDPIKVSNEADIDGIDSKTVDNFQKESEQDDSDSFPDRGEINENDQKPLSKVIITESSTESAPELPHDDIEGASPAELDITNPVMNPQNSESTDTELIQGYKILPSSDYQSESNSGDKEENKKEDDDTFTSPFKTNNDNDDDDDEDLIFDDTHEYERNSRNGLP